MGEETHELKVEELSEKEELRRAIHLFAPRWYLNSFPKSGTHLLECMMVPYARTMPPSQMHPRPWVGTFKKHSWSDEWGELERITYEFGHLLPGYYYKGHCGHSDDLETFLRLLGIAHVFIYRDLRDVVVSQAHHIYDEGHKNWAHPDKEKFRALGGFDACLSACIAGLDEYPGIIARWETYAPWLDVPWVLHVTYREARLEPFEVAKRIITYGIERLAGVYGLDVLEPGPALEEIAREMADSSQDTEKSGTFRRGVVGGWRDEFTGEHVEQFKEADTAGWLVRLGFEKDDKWRL